jgi:hypothetical protein
MREIELSQRTKIVAKMLKIAGGIVCLLPLWLLFLEAVGVIGLLEDLILYPSIFIGIIAGSLFYFLPGVILLKGKRGWPLTANILLFASWAFLSFNASLNADYLLAFLALIFAAFSLFVIISIIQDFAKK